MCASPVREQPPCERSHQRHLCFLVADTDVESRTWNKAWVVVAGSRRSLAAEYGPAAPTSVQAATCDESVVYLLADGDVVHEFAVSSPDAEGIDATYAFLRRYDLRAQTPDNAFRCAFGAPPVNVRAWYVDPSQLLAYAGRNVYRYDRGTAAWRDLGPVPCP